MCCVSANTRASARFVIFLSHTTWIMAQNPTEVAVTGEFHRIRDELVAIDEVSKLLTASELDPYALLDEIVRTTAREMGMKASALRLIDEEIGELVIKAVYGLSPEFLGEQSIVDTRRRFHRMIENDGIIMIGDVRSDPDFSLSKAAETEGICSLLAVGLYRDGKTVGALSVYTDAPHVFTISEVQALRVIANYGSVALELANLHESRMEKEWLERELELAAEIQRTVLPERMPVVPGYDIAGRSDSWEDIGGDFFDFIELPEDNLGIALGDVSGKSVPAALLMFTVRTALRAHAEHEYGIAEIIRRVNHALCRDTKTEQFATLFYGVLNVSNQLMTYVNAGHNPPLLFRRDKIILLKAGGSPVGMLETSRYGQEVIGLDKGDVLVMYTDGYAEITGYEDEGLDDEPFVRVLRANLHRDAEGLIVAVESALGEKLDRADHGDDRTMVVVKVR